jgi:carbon monoxide dehydrogenase subunit G
MPKFEVDKEIAGDIDQAWSLLADFGGTAWIPGIESCEVEGAEGVGQIRKLKMGPMAIHERLESFDPEARSLSYSIVEGPLPTENYLATVSLSNAGDGKVRVQWGASFDIPSMDDDAANGIASSIEGSYSGMVDALAKAIA